MDKASVCSGPLLRGVPLKFAGDIFRVVSHCLHMSLPVITLTSIRNSEFCILGHDNLYIYSPSLAFKFSEARSMCFRHTGVHMSMYGMFYRLYTLPVIVASLIFYPRFFLAVSQYFPVFELVLCDTF